MRISKRHIASASCLGTLLGVPQYCFAAAGAQSLALFIQQHIISQALIAFGGIAAAAVFYYAVRMIFTAHKDESYNELANSFIYVFVGFAIIACASAFAMAFNMTITPTALIPGVNSIIDFVITMSTGIFTLMVVIAGIRMLASQGDEGEFTKARKILVSNCAGVMIMMIAFYIVHAVTDINSGLLVEEMRGIGLFLLTVVGFGCVVALIAAGIFLIISIDESLKDRAKRIVIGTLISLAIVIACYTLIITFVPLP